MYGFVWKFEYRQNVIQYSSSFSQFHHVLLTMTCGIAWYSTSSNTTIWSFPKKWGGGTPKSSILIGFLMFNVPIKTIHFGNFIGFWSTFPFFTLQLLGGSPSYGTPRSNASTWRMRSCKGWCSSPWGNWERRRAKDASVKRRWLAPKIAFSWDISGLIMVYAIYLYSHIYIYTYIYIFLFIYLFIYMYMCIYIIYISWVDGVYKPT